MDQSKQTEAHKTFEKKHSFWKEQRHIVETPQSIEIDEQKCMSMWCNVFQKQSVKPSFTKIKIFKHQKLFCIKTQSICKLGWSDQRHTQLHVQCLAKSNLCSVWN